MNTSMLRTRWAAIGAAVAVTLGAGGLATTYATNPAGAVAFVPITACRLADTRPAPDNVGPRSTPIGAGETLTIAAHGNNGNCTGIPTSATGLSLNVTAIGATNGTFLTIWANGAARPSASSLNPQPGAPPIPNAVTTGLSAGGQFDIFNGFGSVNVIVDVVGYYTDHNHDDRYDDAQASVDGENSATPVTGTAVTLASVTVQTPTSGYVIANSAVTLHGNLALSGARCSITAGTTVDVNALQQAYADANQRQMLSGTRGFTINKALPFGNSSTLTLNLVCDGIGGQPVLEDPQLTAVFVPDPDAFNLIFVPLEEGA